MAIEPNGEFIVSASVEGVSFWGAMTGRHLYTIRDHQIHDHWARYTCLSVQPDNRTVLLAASDAAEHKVQIWNAENGLVIRNFQASGERPGRTAFASNNTLLVVTSSYSGRTIEVWDLATDMEYLKGGFGVPEMSEDVGFSATGEQILTDFGTLSLNSLAMSPKGLESIRPVFKAWDRRGYTVDKSGWVFNNSEKLLWLPPDYRPASFASIAVNGSLIALGCPGKRLVVLEFKQ